MVQEKKTLEEQKQGNQQELLFRLSMFEQQMRQMQEQIESVSQGIDELGLLNFGLDELKESTGKEILAPVGRGIFIGATVNSEVLTVDVGARNFVKKSVSETKEIIEEQVKKLIAVKKDLNEGLEKMSEEARKTLEEFEKNN